MSITRELPTAILSSGKTFAGPQGFRIWGCLPQIHRDPLGFFTRTWREYGDYSRFRVYRDTHHYLLTHPAAIEHVLLKNHENYPKPENFNRSFGLLVGNGLLTTDGEIWLRQRRLTQPAFNRKNLTVPSQLMVSAAEAFVRERTGQTVDMLPEMMRLALHIAGLTLFSTDISDKINAIRTQFRKAFTYFCRQMNPRPWLPQWFESRGSGAFKRSKAWLDRMVLELIESRRRAKDRPKDLLTMLLAAEEEQGGNSITEQELKDHVMTLLVAGHDTVGAVMSWACYLLGKHAQVQEDVYAEVRTRLQGRSPTIDDLAHLPLTKAVFEETLRLFPPAWMMSRQAIAEDEIEGYPIPANGVILVCQYITHRHPEFWVEPDKFNPQRFLPPQATNRPKFAYFPFGGGPRICIGNTFALIEGPLLLATIVQRSRIDLVPGQVVVPATPFNLQPKYGVKVRLWPR